jgi:hypothetical protein
MSHFSCGVFVESFGTGRYYPKVDPGSRPSSPPRLRLRCYRKFGCRWFRFFTGCSTTATKTDPFRQIGSPLRIAGRCHWVLAGEAPVSTIFLDAQSMARIKMPPERQAAPAAFQANNIIGMNASADWHRGCPPDLGFGCRFSESEKRCRPWVRRFYCCGRGRTKSPTFSSP